MPTQDLGPRFFTPEVRVQCGLFLAASLATVAFGVPTLTPGVIATTAATWIASIAGNRAAAALDQSSAARNAWRDLLNNDDLARAIGAALQRRLELCLAGPDFRDRPSPAHVAGQRLSREVAGQWIRLRAEEGASFLEPLADCNLTARLSDLINSGSAASLSRAEWQAFLGTMLDDRERADPDVIGLCEDLAEQLATHVVADLQQVLAAPAHSRAFAKIQLQFFSAIANGLVDLGRNVREVAGNQLALAEDLLALKDSLSQILSSLQAAARSLGGDLRSLADQLDEARQQLHAWGTHLADVLADSRVENQQLHRQTHELQTAILDQGAEVLETVRGMAFPTVSVPSALAPALLDPLSPNNLHFPGRATLLDQLARELTQPSNRLASVLAGFPGLGKSTLALQALHDPVVEARFSSRRFFVRCSAVRSAEDLLLAVANAIGVSDPNLSQAVFADLRIQGAALVLDNFETPWRTPSAREAISSLLRLWLSLPSVAVLLTIRGSDHPTDCREPLEPSLLDPSEAANLFHQESHGIFREDPLVGELLAELAGLPLAVALVARKAYRLRDVDRILALWRSRGPAAVHLADTATESLVFSIRLSWDPLSTAAKAFLARAALPLAGTARDDYEQILGPDPELLFDEVSALVTEDSGARRFSLLPPIRRFILEQPEFAQLDPSISTAVWRHYLALASRGVGAGGRDGAATIARLAPDHPNILQALDYMIAHHSAGNLDEEAGLANALEGFAEVSRFAGWSVGDVYARATALPLADQTLAQVWFSRGMIASTRTDYEEAEQYFGQALSHFELAGDVISSGHCIACLANIALDRGQLEVARNLYTSGIARYERIREIHPRACDRGVAHCLLGLGRISWHLADLPSANGLFQNALHLFHRVGGEALGEINCLFYLSRIQLEQLESNQGANAEDDIATATHNFNVTLRNYEQIGDPLGEANCILSLGRIDLLRGLHDEASARIEQARVRYQQLNHRMGQNICTYYLGVNAQARGDQAEAIRMFQAALEFSARLPTQQAFIGDCHRRLAELTPERAAHLAAARAFWISNNRLDLVARLDAETGA